MKDLNKNQRIIFVVFMFVAWCFMLAMYLTMQ